MTPYGAGAHTCLGTGMAEVLLATLLATIIATPDLRLFPQGYRLKPFHINALSHDLNFRLIRL